MQTMRDAMMADVTDRMLAELASRCRDALETWCNTESSSAEGCVKREAWSALEGARKALTQIAYPQEVTSGATR